MQMKKIISALVGVFCFILSAEVPDKPLLKFFDTAYRGEPSANLLLSPWGIQECYRMIAGGAGSMSSAELNQILGLNRKTMLDLQKARESLQKSKADFNSFNTILLDRKYTLQKSFVHYVSRCCGGKLYRLDFTRKGECAAVLNDIVKRESREMFTNVFQPQNFDGDPVLILLNVLYFKDKWAAPFEKFSTKTEKFMMPRVAGGRFPRHIDVDMMNACLRVPYYSDGTIHGVTLDYADKRFKLLVLAAKEVDVPLQTVTRALADKGLRHFISRSSTQCKTKIKLPKLELQCSVDLRRLLQAQGMTAVFQPELGDLTGMVENNALYVAQSRQLVKLKLDETGTELAAVTYAAGGVGSAPFPESFNHFYADRPFVLVLFDKQTQAILLTAAVVQPGMP